MFTCTICIGDEVCIIFAVQKRLSVRVLTQIHVFAVGVEKRQNCIDSLITCIVTAGH